MSLQNVNAADKLQQKLNDAGYATQVQEALINEQNWLRLRIEGFASREDAGSFAGSIDNQFGIQQPWIVKF
jgi:cell division septation protein DedD